MSEWRKIIRRQELDNAIRNNSLSNAIMFYGEEHYFIEEYAKMLSKNDEASKLNLYYEEYNFSTAKAHLSQASLFGDQNILVIKSEKKIPKKDLDIFIDLCAKNPDNQLIYAYYGDDYKKSQQAFTSKKNHAVEVRFYTANSNESANIILEKARQIELQLDFHTVRHLLLTHNNNLALCVNELSKLKLLNRVITNKEIDEFVYGLGEVKLDILLKQLLEKKEYRSNLQKIIESGEDELRIVTALSKFITELFIINSYIKIHGAPNAIAIYGYNMPMFILKERAELSMRYKQQTYIEIIDILLEAELQIKSHSEKTALVHSTLLKLQTAL